MAAITHSKVSLERIVLESFSIKTFPDVIVEGKRVVFDVDLDRKVVKTENLRYETLCTLILAAGSKGTPIEISGTCRVISSVQSANDREILEDFANLGAVYNAIIFFRELIREITSRTERGPIILPLFDITKTGLESKNS